MPTAEIFDIFDYASNWVGARTECLGCGYTWTSIYWDHDNLTLNINGGCPSCKKKTNYAIWPETYGTRKALVEFYESKGLKSTE